VLIAEQPARESPGLEAALVPGAAVALVPSRETAGGGHDRLGSCGADPVTADGEGRVALAVPAFSTREALSYLSDRLSTDPDQRSGAIDLTGDLDCEPTLLSQAAAMIASSSGHAARAPPACGGSPGMRCGQAAAVIGCCGWPDTASTAARLTGPAVDWWRDLAASSDRILGPGHPDTLAGAYLAGGQAKVAIAGPSHVRGIP
jgi:hypothetical protein